MTNGTALVLGSVIIAIGIGAAGPATEFTKQQISNQRIAQCWSPSLANLLNRLGTQVTAPLLKASYPYSMSQKDKDAVTSSFSATLANYAYTGDSDNGGTINCDAGLSYSYTRPDGTKYSKNEGDIITYRIHPAAGGYSVEMGGASVSAGVVTYVDNH